MDAAEYLRIVSLRKGKLKATEFRLRPGERGLSMFARAATPSPADIIAAVRAAGKQGELAAAAISAQLLRELGLTVVATPGGTPVPEVNRVHAETKTKTQRRRQYSEAIAIVRKHHGSVPLKWWLAQPYAVWLKSLMN